MTAFLWTRLPIPAGILWIPVFSDPVAFFFTGITIPVPPEYFQNPLGNPVCMGPT